MIRRTAAAACVATAVVTACASGPAELSADAAIRAELNDRHLVAEAVTCPATVPAEVGRSVRCQFVVDGQPVDAIATVTSVAGPSPRFAVVTEARPIARDVLARKVGRHMREQARWAVDATTCADDLAAKRGARTDCTVTVDGRPRPVSVVVTSVTGGLITYDIEQGNR